MDYMKDLTNRKHNDKDVHGILLSRLEELRHQSPEYMSKQINVLDTADDTIEGQFERRLQQEKSSFTGKRITLIPYAVGNSHWVVILLEFEADGQIKRAEYIDPVNGANFNPVRLQKQFAKVYENNVLQVRNLQKQDGTRNSLELMIENVLTAIRNVSSPQETGNRSTLSELRQRLNNGLIKWDISDVTKLPEIIHETELRIEDYQKRKKYEKIEKEKAKMKELRELVELSTKISILISSLNADEVKLHYMKNDLISGLGKWKIPDVTKLPERIHEAEQQIEYYQRRRKDEKAERAKIELTELIKLIQLNEDINTFQNMILNRVRKLKEDLVILSEDFPIMPHCAEKTIMELQEYFQRRLLKGSVPSSGKFSPNDLLKNLHNQIKRQELVSKEIRMNLQELDFSIRKDDCFSTVQILKEIFKQIWPLNVQEIRRLVTKAEKAANTIRNKDVILLVGASGSGKSTTIQFIADTRINETKIELIPENLPETRCIVPVTVSLRDVFGVYENEYIILCDVPAFDDMVDIEVDIANGVGVIQALKGCSSVKILALSSYQGLNDRGQGIQKLAHILISILNGIEYQLNSIFYAFTKYPPTMNINSMLLNIQASKVDTHALLKSDITFVRLLDDMIEKTKKGAEIIDPMHGNAKQLIEKLKFVHSIRDPENVFRFSMREKNTNSYCKSSTKI